VTDTAISRRTLRFRGRSFLALILAPEPPFDRWLGELDELAGRSSGFFAGRPIVLDIAALPPGREALTFILAELAARNIRIMAIEARNPADIGPDMPPLIAGGRDAHTADVDDSPREEKRSGGNTLLIDAPIRSGQTVTYPQGDVIILGAIGSGAEVLAGGSIHVYGALRGRAIAGTTGNANSRIFCRKLDPELLAIDGLYLTADGMNPLLRGKAAQIWLSGETMMMAALD
jgi:septum site-determining protein MinC